MSVHDPREVIVDDSDSRIHYSREGWKDVASKNGKKRHITTGNASLSFSFRGSKGRFMGMADTSDSDEDPSWKCFLDGKLQSSPPPNMPGQKSNPELLCEWDSTTVGSHIVTLNVTSKADSNGVRFDRVLYQPDASQTVKNSTIYVPHSDPAINYGHGWKMKNGIHITTNNTAANLSFSFVGSSLSWHGVAPKQYTQNLSVQISMNNKPPRLIPVDIDSNRNDGTMWLFQTPMLEHGQHNLTVSTSLGLSHFVLANSELQPSATISSSSTVSSSSVASETSTSNHSKGKHHSGQMSSKDDMILGFVVGSFFLFLTVLLTLLFLRRRHIRMNKTRCEESASQFFKPGHQVVAQPAILSHEYPFARQSPPQFLSNQYQVNPEKLLTSSSLSSSSTRDRPNSLFAVARLSALPTKGEPGTPRTYHPYVSRRFRFSNFSSGSRQTTTSSVTLLPSPKRFSISLPDDDQTVVMGQHRDSGVIQCHGRPPDTLPPYFAK